MRVVLPSVHTCSPFETVRGGGGGGGGGARKPRGVCQLVLPDTYAGLGFQEKIVCHTLEGGLVPLDSACTAFLTRIVHKKREAGGPTSDGCQPFYPSDARRCTTTSLSHGSPPAAHQRCLCPGGMHSTAGAGSPFPPFGHRRPRKDSKGARHHTSRGQCNTRGRGLGGLGWGTGRESVPSSAGLRSPPP